MRCKGIEECEARIREESEVKMECEKRSGEERNSEDGKASKGKGRDNDT